MATSSEKTLPCTDSKEGSKNCSHNSNAFDIPGMLAPDESKIKEESEKLATDPASFNQLSEQLHRAFPKNPEIVKMAQRLHNNLREMKCAKVLLDGEKRKKKRASHNGRKKHVNIPQEMMGAAE